MPDNSPHTSHRFSTVDSAKIADPSKLIDTICEALLERKAEEVSILDISKVTTLADTFIICHASTDVQIKAIADNVVQKVKEELGEKVWKEEGLDARRWVILDYVNVVVHIFKKDLREFYALERMWNDAEITKVKDQ